MNFILFFIPKTEKKKRKKKGIVVNVALWDKKDQNNPKTTLIFFSLHKKEKKFHIWIQRVPINHTKLCALKGKFSFKVSNFFNLLPLFWIHLVERKFPFDWILLWYLIWGKLYFLFYFWILFIHGFILFYVILVTFFSCKDDIFVETQCRWCQIKKVLLEEKQKQLQI